MVRIDGCLVGWGDGGVSICGGEGGVERGIFGGGTVRRAMVLTLVYVEWGRVNRGKGRGC